MHDSLKNNFVSSGTRRACLLNPMGFMVDVYFFFSDISFGEMLIENIVERFIM